MFASNALFCDGRGSPKCVALPTCAQSSQIELPEYSCDRPKPDNAKARAPGGNPTASASGTGVLIIQDPVKSVSHGLSMRASGRLSLPCARHSEPPRDFSSRWLITAGPLSKEIPVHGGPFRRVQMSVRRSDSPPGARRSHEGVFAPPPGAYVFVSPSGGDITIAMHLLSNPAMASSAQPVIRGYTLVTSGGRHFFTPYFVSPMFLERRASERHLEILPSSLMEYQRRVERKHNRIVHQIRDGHVSDPDVVEVPLSSLTEILLLRGGVEPNPGPTQGPKSLARKPVARGGKRAQLIAASKQRSHLDDMGQIDALREENRELKEKLSEEHKAEVAEKRAAEQEKEAARKRDEYAALRTQYPPGKVFRSLFSCQANPDGTVSLIKCGHRTAMRAAVREVSEDLKVKFQLSNMLYSDVEFIVVDRDILDVGNRARVTLIADWNVTNFSSKLGRMKIPPGTFSIHEWTTIPYLLQTISTPHLGYNYIGDTPLQFELTDVGLYTTPDGLEIDGAALEEMGFHFERNWDKYRSKQLDGVRTAPFVFRVPVNIPDAGSPDNWYHAIAKRMLGLGNPARPPNLADYLSPVVAQLIDYIIRNGPADLPSREKIRDEFLVERTQSEVEEAKKTWVELEDHFSDRLDRYASSSVEFMMKGETYDSAKPPRMIAVRPFSERVVQVYCLGRVLHFIEKALTDSNVKGLKTDEIRAKIVSKYSETGDVFETDFSSFEANLTADVRNLVENRIFRAVAEHLGQDELEIAEPVVADNSREFRPVSCGDGGWHHQEFPTIRLSGDLWTSIGNQVSNFAICMAVVAMMKGVRTSDIDTFAQQALFEGDDGLMAVPDGVKYPKEAFDSAAHKLGFNLKVDAGEWEELSFCGNRMHQLPDGSLVRMQDACHVARKLSTLFTHLPACRRSTTVMVSLQRSKAISLLAMSEAWSPDSTVLSWLIEGATRGYPIDEERRLSHFKSAYGRISEWQPYHSESCLRRHKIDTFRELFSMIPGSDPWLDVLATQNIAAGGTWCRSDIQRMWVDLMDDETHSTALPGEEEEDGVQMVFPNEILRLPAREVQMARLAEGLGQLRKSIYHYPKSDRSEKVLKKHRVAAHWFDRPSRWPIVLEVCAFALITLISFAAGSVMMARLLEELQPKPVFEGWAPVMPDLSESGPGCWFNSSAHPPVPLYSRPPLLGYVPDGTCPLVYPMVPFEGTVRSIDEEDHAAVESMDPSECEVDEYFVLALSKMRHPPAEHTEEYCELYSMWTDSLNSACRIMQLKGKDCDPVPTEEDLEDGSEMSEFIMWAYIDLCNKYQAKSGWWQPTISVVKYVAWVACKVSGRKCEIGEMLRLRA